MEALTQIAAQLGIDHTFYYLFPLVIILYVLLSALYLRPFQKLLHHRRMKTEGARKEAQELGAQAEDKLNQYRVRLKEVHERARRELREREEAARKEEARILGDAAAKAKESLQSTAKQLEDQRRSALEALAADISGLAGEIATKVLGRQVGAR
jgi:F0F1-type ATP synthase membrane subunit b/b'